MQQMEQPIGGVVKCLSNQIRRHLDAAASEAGLVELTGTQGMILHYLLRNEGRCLTQRDVEQRFQLRGATLSRLFQRMEAAGLLERRAVSRDQRCKQLLPTEKARAMHAQFVTCLDETDRLLLQGIRPEDEAVFRSVCLQMLDNLTQQEKSVLLCVVSIKQIPYLKEIVMEIDENSFLIVGDVREVMGNGFVQKLQ